MLLNCTNYVPLNSILTVTVEGAMNINENTRISV